MLEQDITEKRKERHKITQEDFTSPEIVSLFCNIIFYKDIDEEYGIFTKNNISPKYIESIEDIDGNITDYIRIKLKNFNI